MQHPPYVIALLLLLCVGWCFARDIDHHKKAATHQADVHKASLVHGIEQQHQHPRRLMQGQVDLPLQNTNIPTPATSYFTKLSKHVSKPLGTAINGSAWWPGACGSHPSALGYQCSWVAPGGAVLHWTYTSTSSSPPINRCTMQQQAVPNLEIQESIIDGVVHFALQAPTHVSAPSAGARLVAIRWSCYPVLQEH